MKARNLMYCNRTEYTKDKFQTAQEALDYCKRTLKTPVIDIAAILHDKDINDKGELVEPHIHVVIRLKNARSLNRVAQELNVPVQTIEAWNDNYINAYSYLTHQTSSASSKYQYSEDEVVATFDYKQTMKLKRLAEESKQTSLPKISDAQIDVMIDELKEGNIARKEIEELIPGSKLAKFQNKLDVAEKHFKNKQIEKKLKEIKEKNEPISVQWFYGTSGTGKTRMAKKLFDEQNIDYFVAGSSKDPLQNYAGQEALILDELREDTFNYDDLLKILDPYNYEKVGASRYSDKTLVVHTIIITTPYSPKEYYQNVRRGNRLLNQKVDTFLQLARRLSLVLKFKEDSLVFETYDPKLDNFFEEKSSRTDNMFNLKDKSKQSKLIEEKEFLNFMKIKEQIERKVNENEQ